MYLPRPGLKVPEYVAVSSCIMLLRDFGSLFTKSIVPNDYDEKGAREFRIDLMETSQKCNHLFTGSVLQMPAQLKSGIENFHMSLSEEDKCNI